MLERVRLIRLRRLVLHDVEVGNRHFAVQQFDATDVVLIGVGRDEAGDPLSAGLLLQLFDALAGCLGIEVAVDDGEVVAVVLYVKHVAVANGETLYD